MTLLTEQGSIVPSGVPPSLSVAAITLGGGVIDSVPTNVRGIYPFPTLGGVVETPSLLPAYTMSITANHDATLVDNSTPIEMGDGDLIDGYLIKTHQRLLVMEADGTIRALSKIL